MGSHIFIDVVNHYEKIKGEINMCPACYINGLWFLIFGASAAFIADNAWIIAASVLSTIAGLVWMYMAYKKNRGSGGLKSNVRNTLVYLAIFAAGYITAAYNTHDYFKQKYSANSNWSENT